MVGSQARNSAVSHVYSQHKISERRACELIHVSRSSYRYKKVTSKNEEIKSKLKEIAYERKRFGYRRLHILLRRTGYKINHKKTYRLYKESHLKLRKTSKKKRYRNNEKRPSILPMRANQKWAMDFMTDNLTTGKKLRVFNVVDVFSRECPVIEIGTSMPSSKVIEILDNLALERGLPETLKVDNGPEYTSEAIRKWANEKGINLEYIPPGRPMENGHIESFNGKFREECLNQNAFKNMSEAKKIVEEWRVDYNELRPHSALGYKTPIEFLREQVC